MLRVMTYNILYGFHEQLGDSFVFQPDRAAAAREVVHAEEPDVLGLTEAVYGARARYLHQDFASMFRLPHVFFGGDEGDWTSCLVSRYPIVDATRIPLGRHPAGYTMSAIRALVDAGEHGRWRFDLVHPSPHVPEAERVAAFEPLLARTVEPRVVFGDFNALSDEDPYTQAGLVADMLPHVNDPASLATTMLDRRLIETLRAAGLHDTMPVSARTHTIPTRLERASTNGAKLRIDYVLVSDGITASDARVIQSDAADRASDHYPVVVNLHAPI